MLNRSKARSPVHWLRMRARGACRTINTVRDHDGFMAASARQQLAGRPIEASILASMADNDYAAMVKQHCPSLGPAAVRGEQYCIHCLLPMAKWRDGERCFPTTTCTEALKAPGWDCSDGQAWLARNLGAPTGWGCTFVRARWQTFAAHGGEPRHERCDDHLFEAAIHPGFGNRRPNVDCDLMQSTARSDRDLPSST